MTPAASADRAIRKSSLRAIERSPYCQTANSGSSAILVFSRTARGDVAPIRKIQGPDTGLKKPVGLYVDTKNDEVWATNPELHTATVYKRTAEGNVKPLRTLRSAPDGAAAPGIGNPGGIAYDPVREQILVPN